MAIAKEDILNAIAEMTVMDIVDLISAMEENSALLRLLQLLLRRLLLARLLLLKNRLNLTSF